MIELLIPGLVALGILGTGVYLFDKTIKVVDPTERGLVERMGKYQAYAEPGLLILIPFVDTLRRVNITEDMVDADEQTVITKDSLNARVDAQVYFKVKSDEDSVKSSQYKVTNYKLQIVNLARTTLRAILGGMDLDEANSQRDTLNKKLEEILSKETKDWGIEVVRTELKEVDPPKEVQDVMNRVVIAQKEKTAATDFATAQEIKADGAKRASIKEAEGEKESSILKAQAKRESNKLEAEGEALAIEEVANANAKAIKVVNESAQRYFKDSAVTLKKLEVADSILKNNTKLIVSEGTNLVNLVGDSVGVNRDIIPISLQDMNIDLDKKNEANTTQSTEPEVESVGKKRRRF